VGIRPQRLALTSPISGGRFVGIVRSRNKDTELLQLLLLLLLFNPTTQTHVCQCAVP
jgi:hypothetical protein